MVRGIQCTCIKPSHIPMLGTVHRNNENLHASVLAVAFMSATPQHSLAHGAYGIAGLRHLAASQEPQGVCLAPAHNAPTKQVSNMRSMFDTPASLLGTRCSAPASTPCIPPAACSQAQVRIGVVLLEALLDLLHVPGVLVAIVLLQPVHHLRVQQQITPSMPCDKNPCRMHGRPDAVPQLAHAECCIGRNLSHAHG